MRQIWVLAAVIVAFGVAPAMGNVGIIQGSMSNFDVFNETTSNVYGAELELEGVHSAEVTKTYPSHFNNMVKTDYTNGATFGTRLTFSGYNFDPVGYIIPTVGISTNGHYAVNLKGCEHFGFSVSAQPTATRYFWTDQPGNRIGSAPMTIPTATWTYVAPAGGNPAVMQAVLVPPPPPPAVMYPDAVWVKTFVTELTRQADLNELISFDPDNLDPNNPSVAPQSPAEVEAEWELLPGDSPLPEPDIQIHDVDQSIIRRYEFYQYTGTYDEVHLPNYQFTGGPLPADAPLGQFIAANMVAVNLVPEPSSLIALLFGGGTIAHSAMRRRK